MHLPLPPNARAPWVQLCVTEDRVPHGKGLWSLFLASAFSNCVLSMVVSPGNATDINDNRYPDTTNLGFSWWDQK